MGVPVCRDCDTDVKTETTSEISKKVRSQNKGSENHVRNSGRPLSCYVGVIVAIWYQVAKVLRQAVERDK